MMDPILFSNFHHQKVVAGAVIRQPPRWCANLTHKHADICSKENFFLYGISVAPCFKNLWKLGLLDQQWLREYYKAPLSMLNVSGKSLRRLMHIFMEY